MTQEVEWGPTELNEMMCKASISKEIKFRKQ
jgi:hypothetical protein